MRSRDRCLVFSPITKKWEMGHKERVDLSATWQWVRDDMSWICYVGEEIATAPLPVKPFSFRRIVA